jgi:hypothetical protein
MLETQVVTEPVINQVTPPSIVPDQSVVITPAKDLVSRVAEFKKSQVVKPTTTSTDGIILDQKMIDAITDPVLKEAALNLHKSVQSDYTRKTQAVAESRKTVEAQLESMQNWTPERIQQYCLNNPSFVTAAQKIAGNQSVSTPTDEYSAMTPQEKARIDALMSKVSTLEQSNFQATVAQRDTQLQTRYPDYNPIQIDETIKNLAQMNPLDIREHVYKSLKHDEDVAAAYELGRSEKESLNQTKINAITSSGNTVTNSDGLPTREKGDTDQMYFMKLANFRLAQFKNRK